MGKPPGYPERQATVIHFWVKAVWLYTYEYNLKNNRKQLGSSTINRA